MVNSYELIGIPGNWRKFGREAEGLSNINHAVLKVACRVPESLLLDQLHASDCSWPLDDLSPKMRFIPNINGFLGKQCVSSRQA